MEATVKFKSIPNQLYEYLSDSIIEGKITPGEKLIENELSHQFGVSRAPIRECFRILESEGLIEIQPRKGAFVKVISREEVESVFPVRIALECLASKLAVPNITEKDIKALSCLIAEMEKAIISKNTNSFIRLNYSFHTVFIKASKNQVLERTLKTLQKGFWLRLAYLYYDSASGLGYSNNTHKKIVRAFQERDATLVQRLIEEHIERAKEELLRVV